MTRPAPPRARAAALMLLFALAAVAWPRRAAAQEPSAAPMGADQGKAPAGLSVRVVVPDPDNLQYLSFWVALGAGYFQAEGLDIQVSSPSVPAIVDRFLKEQNAPAAVLPPPMYLQLIADRFPIKLVANLLKNDGINLIVRRSIMKERNISADAPLADRLRRIQGLRVGVAPGPAIRLRTLFSSQGLVADDEIAITVVPGHDQNDLFAKGKVDALYAHTPYLETALVEQDAVMLVNQSAGEVPALAGLQIHALVVTAAFAAEHADAVLGMTRAIYRAEQLVHADRAATSAAVLRALPALRPQLVEALVAIYEPAVPSGPEVSVDGFSRALTLFPARKPLPTLEPAELASYVEPRFAAQVVSEGRKAASSPAPPEGAAVSLAAKLFAAGAALGLAALTAWAALRSRRSAARR